VIPLPKTTNPLSIDVQNLCRHLDPNSRCISLKIEPVKGAIENDCYGNVDKAILLNGGKVKYGWKIWETLPGLMIEAEFHAVWVDIEGSLHEVSPVPLPEIDSILFLQDTSRTYNGTQIDNVRIAIVDDQLVNDYIENAKRRYTANNRGVLATQHGYIEATPEMKALSIRDQELFIRIIEKFYS
jgi:hypothetical protein